MRRSLPVWLVLLSAGSSARAWWDTQVRAQTAEPLVQAVEAHQCGGAKAVRGGDGGTRSWYMPIAYRTDYAVVSKLYFPLHADGECDLRVG
jgi:hypothetical protein